MKKPIVKISNIIAKNGVFTDGDWVESKDQDPLGDVRLIQLADIGERRFINKSNRRLTSAKAKELRCTYLNEGDILLARMPDPLGRCCLFPKMSGLCVTVVDICIIRPNNPEVDLGYLVHVLNDKSTRIQMETLATGTTRTRISRGNLVNIQIPLPPLEDQVRISHLLGRVEGLIAQRKKDLSQLDQLLKSVFLEMFGDPVRNEKGWEKKRIGDILDNIDSGWSPQCEARKSQSHDEWGVLKLGAVTSCEYNADENKALIGDYNSKSKIEVRNGDLLFTRKNTYELVAACAYVFKTRPRLLMPDLIFRLVIKTDSKINPLYLWKLLTNKAQRKAIQSLAGGASGSMPNISKAKLLQQLIPVPRQTLQNKFASIVEKTESTKSSYQRTLADLETLYGALSQKAFQGELDLSRVPTHFESQLRPTTTITSSVTDQAESATHKVDLQVHPVKPGRIKSGFNPKKTANPVQSDLFNKMLP